MKKEHIYSQDPRAIRYRKCQDRSRKLIDLRVCMRCRYGFISRWGYNICSVCLFQVKQEFIRANPHYICRRFSVWRGWARREASKVGMGRMFRWTINPRIPFPLTSRTQPAVARSFEGLRKSVEADNKFMFDQMPRIEGVGPFPEIPEQLSRGTVHGR